VYIFFRNKVIGYVEDVDI